jgi:hypothetical protein
VKSAIAGFLGGALLFVGSAVHADIVNGYAWCEPNISASGQYETKCSDVNRDGGGGKDLNLPGTDDPNYSGMWVMNAAYGRNCGAPYNNATTSLQHACNDEMVCDYVVDYRVLGDPAPGCAKNFFVTYVCSGKKARTRVAEVAAEAGFGSVVHLTCQ